MSLGEPIDSLGVSFLKHIKTQDNLKESYLHHAVGIGMVVNCTFSAGGPYKNELKVKNNS